MQTSEFFCHSFSSCHSLGLTIDRNIPWGIMIGIPIVSICYVMVNVAFFAGLSRAELLSSETTGLVRMMNFMSVYDLNNVIDIYLY